jgi:hypothetical protein
MSILAGAEVTVAPVLALGAVVITGLRLNGWLDEEVLTELQKPFSRVTLTVVAMVSLLVGQLCWFAAQF